MRYIDLPLLGRRPVSELDNAGVLEPEPAELGDTSAGAWVYARRSLPGVRREWWYHRASELWFLVERDTGSDEVHAVSLAGPAGDEPADG